MSAVFTAWSSLVRPASVLDIMRPASSRMRILCWRSVSYSTVIGLPRRAVAVHEIERGSSSGRYSRSRSNTVPEPGTRATLTRVVREAAAQRHLVTPDLVQVGVDVRRRRRGDATLALDEVERTP